MLANHSVLYECFVFVGTLLIIWEELIFIKQKAHTNISPLPQNINTPIKSHEMNMILLLLKILQCTKMPHSRNPMYSTNEYQNKRIGGLR